MKRIDFISKENVTARCYEVLTLSNGMECVDIWPNDILRIILWDDNEYVGKVCWSIEPGCICMEYEERITITISPRYVKSVEMLKYSSARVMSGGKNRGE